MGIRRALLEGIGLVRESGRYVLLAYAASLALALPLAAVLFVALHESFGHGAAAETMRSGFDDLWHQGFSARAHGLASTFGPSVVGIGPVADGLDALVSAHVLHHHPAIVAVGLAYLVAWVLLSAGFVARYAGRRERGFLGGAARYFSRFLALAGLAVAAYALVFGAALFGLTALVDVLVREVVDERVHFAYTLTKYGLVWAMAWCIALVTDYAKIISVVEDLPPIRKALVRAVRTVFPNARQVFGLSASVTLATIVSALLFWTVAPGAGQASWSTVLLAFAIGQVYLLVRVAIRCWLLASQTRMCISLVAKG